MQYQPTIIYLFLLLSFWSCTDLEEELVGQITNDIVGNADPLSFDTGPLEVINPAYAGLREIGLANHGAYFTVQEVSTDEFFVGVKGNDWNSGGDLIRLHQHTYTPDEFFFTGAWNSLYNAIALANESLANPDLPTDERAEVRALRAYYYLCLLDLFGRVKLVTETNPNPPQSSRIKVFEFVERELLATLEVEELGPNMEFEDIFLYSGFEVYRINHFAVLGFLAKLYLNAEVYTGLAMYEKAEVAASYIINSGHYQLCAVGCDVPNPGYRPGVETDPEQLEGYAAVFAPNNEDNPEHIFAVNFHAAFNGGMNFAQMNLHYASQRSWRLQEQPWNGYATLEEFYNAYDDQDARKEASFLAGPQLDFYGSAILDYEYDDGNIHLNYTPEVN